MSALKDCRKVLRRAAGRDTRSGQPVPSCQVPGRVGPLFRPARGHRSLFVVTIPSSVFPDRSRATSRGLLWGAAEAGPTRAAFGFRPRSGQRPSPSPGRALATFADGAYRFAACTARTLVLAALIALLGLAALIALLGLAALAAVFAAAGVPVPMSGTRPLHIDTGHPTAPSPETPTPSSDPSKSCCWASTNGA